MQDARSSAVTQSAGGGWRQRLRRELAWLLAAKLAALALLWALFFRG